MADCVPCHFDYEEEVALPHLPVFWQRWLLAEHVRIRAMGYPPAEVLSHAEREMAVLRQFCPPDVVAQVLDDHVRLEPELRAAAQTATSARIAGCGA